MFLVGWEFFLSVPSQILIIEESMWISCCDILCEASYDVLRRVYEMYVWDAISKDHDSPMSGDPYWFDPPHASCLGLDFSHVGIFVGEVMDM
jgi:hypothetical protein